MTFEYNQQSIEKAIIYKKQKRKINQMTPKLKKIGIISFFIISLIIVTIVSFSRYHLKRYDIYFTKTPKAIYADYYKIHGTFMTFYKYWWRTGKKEVMTCKAASVDIDMLLN